MIKNYLKVAVRNLFRQKFYTIINISGLSIGIAISLLIAFYVYDELSYDKFHTDADRIHQIYLKAMLQGKPIEGANTCAPIAAASKEELTGVEDAIRINLWRDIVFRNEDTDRDLFYTGMTRSTDSVRILCSEDSKGILASWIAERLR